MREWALTPSEAVEADLRDHGQRRMERHPPDRPCRRVWRQTSSYEGFGSGFRARTRI